MSGLSVSTEARRVDRGEPAKWSVPQAAALVVLLSGGLWIGIIAIARWLIA